jgi:hypothetical protein
MARSLARLRRLAHLMDDRFQLPLVKTRIGLDPIIGLIPGGGDWATWVVSVYIFWEALRLGASSGLLWRMAANVTVDLVAGYVPAVGDLVDIAFKANKRNVDLLFETFGARTLPDSGEVVVPSEALARRHRGLRRWLVGAGLLLLLLGFAALPLLLLAWYLRS